MKICMLTTSFPRYKGDLYLNFAYSLAKELAKKNKVYAVSSHGLDTKNYEKRDNIEIFRYYYFFPRKFQMLTYRGGMIENYKRSIFAKLQLIPFFISFLLKGFSVAKKADIIHAQVILSGLVGAIIKKFIKKPLVLTVHGTDVNSIGNNILFNLLAKFVFNNCDRIIAISNDLKKTLINKFKIDKEKIAVIPYGIDANIFRKTNKNNERKKLKLDPDSKILLFAGRINKEKGLDYLIRAVSKARNVEKNILLAIIGEGPEKENLEKLTKRLNLEKHVDFAGAKKQDELPSWMNSADMLVLPSLSEGLGMVLIEAMACGTAVIGTKVGGILDIIDDNINGMLVEPKNAEQLYKKIAYLLKDKEVRDKLALNGMKKAIEKFGWKKCAGDTLNVYEEITK